MPPVSYDYPRTKRAARWPLKADYKTISREDAKVLVGEFGAMFGLDVFRIHGNFKHLPFSTARHFDSFDLSTAIQFMIDYLHDDASAHADTALKDMLIKRLEAACGPLDKPIALSVGTIHRAFSPARA